MIKVLHARLASAAGARAAPVLDAKVLTRLTELDASGSGQLLQRVMGAYCKSLPRLVGQLVTARDPFDPDAMQLAVHTLKSSSGNVGALGLSELCGLAEAELRDRHFESLPSTLDALLAEAERVELAVHQLLLPARPDLAR